eukprot:3974995-Prymnesium_polylepis.1
MKTRHRSHITSTADRIALCGRRHALLAWLRHLGRAALLPREAGADCLMLDCCLILHPDPSPNPHPHPLTVPSSRIAFR